MLTKLNDAYLILKEAMHILKLRSSVFLVVFFQNSTKSSPIHLYHLFLGMLHRGGAQNWSPSLYFVFLSFEVSFDIQCQLTLAPRKSQISV